MSPSASYVSQLRHLKNPMISPFVSLFPHHFPIPLDRFQGKFKGKCAGHLHFFMRKIMVSASRFSLQSSDHNFSYGFSLWFLGVHPHQNPMAPSAPHWPSSVERCRPLHATTSMKNAAHDIVRAAATLWLHHIMIT